MAAINETKLTREQILKAMACETPEELIALAKAVGYEITKEEAEAYIAELSDFELDGETLVQAAGGSCYGNFSCDGNETNPAHTKSCFAGDSEVAVPGGVKRIMDLEVGGEVITLDVAGKEIVGIVTEVMTPREEEIVEVSFSNGAFWRTTASQTLYLGHEKNIMVKDAKGTTALLRDGGTATVTDVKFTGTRETVYDVLVGEEEDEDVIFVAGVAAEGDFTKGERGL
jgi:predicted ribosomally synthesized peptide with nif11-like leader